MHIGDLTRIDEALAIKAHLMVLTNLGLEAFLIIKIREDRIEALNFGRMAASKIRSSGRY